MKVVNQKYFFKVKGIFAWLLCITSCSLVAQQDSGGNKKNRRFIAYPLGYYSPETRTGIGVAATFNFRINEHDSIAPASQLSFGGGLTQNRQASISLPFALYFRERIHSVSGEVTYNRFNYDFYGTGSGNYRGDKAVYNTEFPLFRVNYLYRFQRNLFAGARWWYEDYRIISFEENPALKGNIPGKMGSRTSGPGVVFLFDRRDNIYYSTRGSYLELSWQTQSAFTGSNFFYDRYRFDFRNFLSLSPQLVIASNFFGDFILGNVPFSQMPAMGSGKRARGFYQGRFRDKNLLLYQGEVRQVLDAHLAMTAFWNYGLLSDQIDRFNFHNDHASVGIGFRYAFDKENRSNLRLDLAWPFMGGDYIYDPDNTMKIYFTVNEAF